MLVLVVSFHPNKEDTHSYLQQDVCCVRTGEGADGFGAQHSQIPSLPVSSGQGLAQPCCVLLLLSF